MTQPLSVQLYTVRDALGADLPGTLQRIADIGYTNVEAFGFVDNADELAAALRDAGLAAPSGHARLLDAGEQDLERIFHASTTLGFGTLIDPHIDESRWTTREDVEAIARELSALAPRAADHGLLLGYHNHAFEFSNRIDGVSAYEVFADALSDDVVLELDTYWVQVGGDDPVAVIGKYGDKVQFLHVKDGDGSHDDKQQVAVGNGIMPIREIIAAAPDALHVVELDDHEGDVFQAVADSYTFLEGARA
ncbi:sugar phosphate isomerase/epimerase family protein [Curtobacterium flaccumfaciens]|uniref:sugar phosphate isomerase/epimerase family protein n=1 Tax=Curtobacterium flaccumfaciens TaxID=2035 RepID=UPI001BDE273A|nr:sugar phosphate isomerase/epimerase [Curtobacterium flaccumfaciens]MBT1605363.1 sugar phosphate isomerase/epimerase [Curtobacterium flaccumfaciens pv. betae]MBT1655528.1 sugar phosphate isomerase/epimerase [Curtobacterium flaccumfaciens pv. betae]MCS0470414.1 sugar phosphate isomerase/epimerase [Curtobacterium flaccumfaciens pv. betae]MCS0473778.1 sugar phosphate isomerase/epimerase [Curtobacterium flaccumfaciens pv. betae]MCS0478717.1 sugar phosphate isomerase/epimerase [Curtobacterium fla